MAQVQMIVQALNQMAYNTHQREYVLDRNSFIPVATQITDSFNPHMLRTIYCIIEDDEARPSFLEALKAQFYLVYQEDIGESEEDDAKA